MKTKHILILMFFLSLRIGKSFSQDNNIVISDVVLDNFNAKIFAKFEEGNKYAIDSITEVNTLIKLNNAPKKIEYRKEREYKDDLGFIHKVFQQYYNGYLIVGASYVLHERDNELKYTNGNYANITELSLLPKISESEVLSKVVDVAVSEFHSKKPIIKNEGLVICSDYINKDRTNKLSYKILLQDDEYPIYSYYYIDASTGKILAIQNLICYANTNGSVQTNYSGTKNIISDSYNGQYRLKENRQGVNITTKNNQNNDIQLDQFTVELLDNDNSWTTTEHPIDKYAHDAHWASEKIFDYWKTVHNRNSIDNNGLPMRTYIHHKTNFNNALWHPHSSYLSVHLGDGDGTTYSNFANIETCAHEYGHGIAQFTANFNLLTFENFALSEGFADIWGAVIEDWAMPNSPPKNKWLISEEIKLTSPFYERRLDNPNLINYGDTYNSGSYWGNNYRRMSTVLGYWFYLLSESSGCITTNDFGNNVYVSKIGIDKAAKIAYRTLQLLNSSADFNMVRTMSIQATTELYGVNSVELISVKNAWYAVGIGTQSTITYPPNTVSTLDISGSNSICSGSQNYSIPNLPAGATVVWSRTPTNTTTLSQVNNIATITKTSNGFVSLTATITINCGTSFTYVTTKNINVGIPYTLWDVNGCQYPEAAIAEDSDGFPCNTQCYSPSNNKWWCAQPVYNATNVTWQKVWSVPSTYNFWSGSWSGNSNNVSIIFKSPNQSVVLKTTISNPCGSIEQYYCFSSTNILCSANFRTADCKQYQVSISNNMNKLNISKGNEKCEGLNTSQINLIQIVDKVGNVVNEQKISNEQQIYEIDLSSVKNDVYFVLLQYDNFVETHQIGIFK